MPDDTKHPSKNNKIKFKRSYTSNKKKNTFWVLGITITSFLLSILISIISMNLIYDQGFLISLIIVLIIILIAIIFDTIGIASTSCNITPFYSLASRKKFGAKTAIIVCKNADKVSTLCNDVVGDICGIISGVASSYIIFVLIGSKNSLTPLELIITGIVASLTVGGKSFGKIIAINFSNYIIYWVSVLLELLLGIVTKHIKLKDN